MTTDNKIFLTLMRHARSRADDEGVHEGRYDSPLTDAGRAQVHQRGDHFLAQGYKPDVIICSTLIRAQETAQIVGSMLGVPVEPDEGWMEFDNRPLAGLTFEEADRLYPRPEHRNPFDALHNIGESEIDFHARISLALQRIIRRGTGRYLIVSHGGALNVALRVAFSIPLPVNNSGHWFAFGDTGYAQLEYYPLYHTWIMRELAQGLD